MTRLSWSEYFMEMARLAAKRSTCLRRQVGAVAVRDNRVLATGYNGAPSGLPHCSQIGCLRNQLHVPSGERHELCLSGDTIVKMLDGCNKTLEELCNEHVERFWVYGYKPGVGVVPAEAECPRFTGIKECVRVVLDNGASFICTADHRILQRNEHYCAAGNLQQGSSLMAMYCNYARNNGYESVALRKRSRRYDAAVHGSIPTHKLVLDRLGIAYDINVQVCHHISGNRLDNRPENLCLLKRGEHSRLHDPLSLTDHVEAGRLGSLRAKELGIYDSPEWRESRRQSALSQWSNPAFREYMKPHWKKCGVITASRYNSDTTAIICRQIGNIMAGLSRLLFLTGGQVNAENYEQLRHRFSVARKLREKGAPPPKVDTILKYFPSVDDAIENARYYNHKVVSVEPAGFRKVYDLSVPETENFAIFAGDNSWVFAHNCNSVHAEQNLLVQAARHGISLKGCTVYCTHQPCIVCAKLLVGVGIKAVLFFESYPDQKAFDVLTAAGVECEAL